MRLSQLDAFNFGGGKIKGMKSQRSEVQSTGEQRGTRCPPGEVKLRSRRERTAKGWVDIIECGIPRAPAPVAAPEPAPITVATQITPTFQQQFTPQVSPVMQLSTGSGQLTGGTEQRASGSQQAASPQGISAEDLQRILSEERQADQLRRDQEASIREREAARIREQETQRARELEAQQAAIYSETSRFRDTGGGAAILPQRAATEQPSMMPADFQRESTKEKMNYVPLAIGAVLLSAALYMNKPKKGRKK